MESNEHRLALRVPCCLPVRLRARGRTYMGTIRDVSRTGLRVSVPTSALETDDDSLLVIARLVETLIGSNFEGDLHYEMLGPLVRKRMRLIRLGQRTVEQAFELGCVFDSPISDDESGMLGLGLPDLGVTTADAYRDVPAPRHRGSDEACQGVAPAPYDAYLHPAKGLAAEPLAGASLGMTDLEAIVDAQLPARLANVAVPSLTVALAETYGQIPRLEILDGLRLIWSGDAEIQQVEVSRPERVRIHLTSRG